MKYAMSFSETYFIFNKLRFSTASINPMILSERKIIN